MTNTMEAYQVESFVNEDGTIHLPAQFKKHRVKLVVYDLDAIRNDPVEYFKHIVNNYCDIHDERDLDFDGFYRECEHSHVQRPVFA